MDVVTTDSEKDVKVVVGSVIVVAGNDVVNVVRVSEPPDTGMALVIMVSEKDVDVVVDSVIVVAGYEVVKVVRVSEPPPPPSTPEDEAVPEPEGSVGIVVDA